MDKKIKSRLPPFTEALINHTKEKQFPFDTPGHHGGDFYNLTEEGKAFTRFYGNAMFAADMSDSGNDPGALLPMKARQGQRKNWQPTPSAQTGHGSSSMALPFPTVFAARRFLRKTISSSLTGTAINPSTRAPSSNAAPFPSSWTPCDRKAESSAVSTNTVLTKSICGKKRHALHRKARTRDGPTALPLSSLPPTTAS